MDVSAVHLVVGVATSMIGSVLLGYLPERVRHPRRHARVSEANRTIFTATARLAESADLFTARDIAAVIANVSLSSGIPIARLVGVKQVIQHHVSCLVSAPVPLPDMRERVEALWALDRRVDVHPHGQMRMEDRSTQPAWAIGRALAAGSIAALSLLALGYLTVAVAAGILGAWVVLEVAQRPEQVTDVTDRPDASVGRADRPTPASRDLTGSSQSK